MLLFLEGSRKGSKVLGVLLSSKDDIFSTHSKIEGGMESWKKREMKIKPGARKTSELLMWQLFPGEFVCTLNRFNFEFIHFYIRVFVPHVPSLSLDAPIHSVLNFSGQFSDRNRSILTRLGECSPPFLSLHLCLSFSTFAVLTHQSATADCI